MSQLQAAIETLRDQSNPIDKFIGEHETIFIPAHKLFPEILSEIFIWCLANDGLKSPKDAPIVLGQVCSYWRSVTISTPNLWSSLKLYIDSSNVQSSIWLVNTALTRSSTCPLTINLSTSHKGWDERANSCLDTILYHSRHWKLVSFQFPFPELRKLSAVKHALPILESLELWEGVFDYYVLDAFEVAPRLRSLCTDMLFSILKVPGGQLERFNWSGRSGDCLDWLHRCPNLVECWIILYGYLVSPSSLMVHLPRLVKLKIVKGDQEEDVVDLENLFNNIVTPVLTDLHIDYDCPDGTEWVQSTFVSFLCRSACTLRKLHLTDIPITDVQLIECLRILPSLAELIIGHSVVSDPFFLPVTDNFLQQLIYRPPKLRSLPVLSPQLQAINFKGSPETDGRIFGDMVASRWRIDKDIGVGDLTFEIARLKSVAWRMHKKLDEESKARLEKCNDEGLELDTVEVTWECYSTLNEETKARLEEFKDEGLELDIYH